MTVRSGSAQEYLPRACGSCGTEYVPQRKNQNACSAACTQRACDRKRRERRSLERQLVWARTSQLERDARNAGRRAHARQLLGLPEGTPTAELQRVRKLCDDVTYGSAHSRVEYFRGKASDYACADCGEQARDWSYNHCDPRERRGPSSRGFIVPYSLNPELYDPRCRRCHTRFDQREARVGELVV